MKGRSSLFCFSQSNFLLLALLDTHNCSFLHYSWWDRADLPELPCSLQLGSSPGTPWWAGGGLTQAPRSPGLLAPASSDGLLRPAGQTTQAAASTATENVASLATHMIPMPKELLVQIGSCFSSLDPTSARLLYIKIRTLKYTAMLRSNIIKTCSIKDLLRSRLKFQIVRFFFFCKD